MVLSLQFGQIGIINIDYERMFLNGEKKVSRFSEEQFTVYKINQPLSFVLCAINRCFFFIVFSSVRSKSRGNLMEKSDDKSTFLQVESSKNKWIDFLARNPTDLLWNPLLTTFDIRHWTECSVSFFSSVAEYIVGSISHSLSLSAKIINLLPIMQWKLC